MYGSTHIFRNHQGVELMGYGSNGNEFDRIVWRSVNASKAEHQCAFFLRAGIDKRTGRLLSLLSHHSYVAVVEK